MFSLCYVLITSLTPILLGIFVTLKRRFLTAVYICDSYGTFLWKSQLRMKMSLR